MRKRFLSSLLALCMALALLPVSVFAEGETIVASGKFGAQGDNLTWALDSEGTLTINGEGEMGNTRPWSPFNGSTIHSHNIKTVKIGDGITTIGDSIFFDCRNLQSVTLPDGLLSINDSAFWGCSALTQVDIPHTVTTIGDYAFRGCASLTGVTIPSGVTALGRGAFQFCLELSDLVIEEGVTDISSAFEDCDKLIRVNLPSSIINMSNAFSSCDSLTSIRIPSSVKAVGNIPFYFCTSLTEIIVDKGNTVYTDVDGVLFTKDLSALVAYPIGNTRTAYTISDGVTTVNYGAFIHCTNLTSMSIPASVTTVECDATSACYNLKDVYYAGTREQWEQIQFLNDPTGDHLTGDVLRDAALHCIDDQYTVTYDSNGGTGTMADTLVGPSDVYTFPACGFIAPVGKEFRVWRVNSADYDPNDYYAISADTTVVAIWMDTEKPSVPSAACTLSGAITGHQGVAYAAVTAKLVGLDGTEHTATVTGGESLDGTTKKECTYSVSAPAGQYNLIVEATTAESVTVNRAALVKLTGGSQTKNVNLPNGQAKSSVNVEKSGTQVIAGNLDSLIVNDSGNMLEGTSAEIALTVESVNTSAPEAVSIQEAASGQTLDFFEFTIQKTVDGDTTDVNDTGDTPIEIVLPFERAGKRNIKVYRCHSGRVDVLTEQTVNGEKIEVTENSITIYAKKFSVYAIGYVADTGNQQPTTPSTPSSGGGVGSSDSGYRITAPSRVTGGTVKTSPTSAEKGDTVTITVTPNSGYELNSLIVTDRKGNELTLTDKGSGKYTFTMPGSKVNVEASFKQVAPAAPSVSFIDVQSGAYYYDAVTWAVEKDITAGTSAATFSPDNPCTRAQIVTFLWRAAGSPRANASSIFTDVPVDSYYYDAVLWAVEQGITSGTSANTFSPDATCTRAQAVTFLHRYEKSPEVSGGNTFTDVVTDAYYSNAVQWAVDKNVTAGTSATTFSPDQTCTRAQIVTFLYRAFAN